MGDAPELFPRPGNRSRAWARTRKQPRACAAGRRHKPGARLARRSRATCLPQARVRARRGEEKTRCATCPPQVWAFARPQGTETRLSPCPGKQKPGVGPHPEPDACVRDVGKKKTRCATCSAQPRDLPTAGVPGAAARPEPAACVRGLVQAQTRCASCPPQARDLPGAAARLAHRRRGLSPRPGKQKPCVGAHPEPAACVRGWAKEQTGCATCSAQPRELLTAGVQVVI